MNDSTVSTDEGLKLLPLIQACKQIKAERERVGEMLTIKWVPRRETSEADRLAKERMQHARDTCGWGGGVNHICQITSWAFSTRYSTTPESYILLLEGPRKVPYGTCWGIRVGQYRPQDTQGLPETTFHTQTSGKAQQTALTMFSVTHP